MKLDCKELRIGNWLNIIGLVTIQITAKHILLISEGDDQYEPIPLTEEWLEKFGIEFKDEDKLYWVNGAFNLERNIDDDCEYYFEVYSHYIPVKWVHQLQNLYWCLVGEELKIN